MRFFFLVSAAFFALSFSVAMAGPRTAGFTGTWKVTLSPDNQASSAGAKTIEETVVFAGEQMTTTELAKHGFGPATYTDDAQRIGPATFTCNQTSDKEGKIAWQGMTTGQDLTGTIVWTKKDGTVLNFSIQGTKNPS